MKSFFTTVFTFFFIYISFAQSNFWQKKEENIQSRTNQLPLKKVSFYTLNLENLKASLKNAPLFSNENAISYVKITLPINEQIFESFEVFESPVMEEGLAKKFPFIKTYIGYGTNGKVARFGFDKNDFHALINDENGNLIYIESDKLLKNSYLCYHSNNIEIDEDLKKVLQCGVDEKVKLEENTVKSRSNGEKVTLRSYRLALACTGEYATKFGGTTESVISNFTTVVNRINLIYNREASIDFKLIAQNDKLINLTTDDGYENGNLGSMLEQNPFQISSKIATSDYDIGHVVGTKNTGGVIGLAQLAVACDQQRKAYGASCILPNVSLDFFTITVVAHELGHQFGAPHTFSDCGGSGTSGVNSVEPSCGTSIMSYGFDANDYFNIASLGYIWNFSRNGAGNTCPTQTLSNNSSPDVKIEQQGGFSIPISTPFELMGGATDVDNNNLTYCWEQVNVNQSLDPAIFRSPVPSANSTRLYPELQYILRGQLIGNDDALPTISRNLGFRLTVRDNAVPNAGQSWQEIIFKVTDTAGPFKVSSQNDANNNFIGGQLMEVKWDVNNTNLAPVNCQKVDIFLSTDNGQTFPTSLISKTNNDGIEYIVLPNMDANSCRIKVKASENIFFDINDRSFSIQKSTMPSFSLGVNNATSNSQICLPTQFSFDINSLKINDYNKKIYLSLDKTKLPSGTIPSFSKDSISAGENAVLNLDLTKTTQGGTFTFEITGKSKDKLDSVKLPITIKVLANDFSDIALNIPRNALAEVQILPAVTFNWAQGKNAENYTFQLATNPAFETKDLAFQKENVVGGIITPNVSLSENTIYYWRIIPKNVCGAGKPSAINVFQTIANACNTYKNETALNIPSNAATSVESLITVNEDGEINDVNVGPMVGFHDFFKDVEMSLISPKGTAVKLFSDICANSGDFEFSIDDQATSLLSCPPTRNTLGKSLEPLSTFNKESSKGVWKLKISDSAVGSGGRLTSWNLKLCSKLNIATLNKVKNDTIAAEKGKLNPISQTQLSFDDGLNLSNNLIYTLVSIPVFGNLQKEGVALAVGTTFSQADINAGKITYKHNGGVDKFDTFNFVLSNGKGAWLPNGKANLKILNTAIEEIGDENLLSIFPNPTDEFLNIELSQNDFINYKINIYNIQGQLIHNQKIINNKTLINVKNLVAGIYIIKVSNDKIAFVKRFVKE